MLEALLVIALASGATGCPKKSIALYRSLGEPGAMQTCDANTRFRASASGADEQAAKANAEAEIRAVVAKNKGCGAFLYNEGAAKTLAGTVNHVADYQLCRCR